jgi:thiamine biosynthesis lipoprotein
MRRERFRAMGTTISALPPQQQAATGIAAVSDLFATWEHTLSRFLSESELSHLNRHAGGSMAVSPLLFQVVTTALAAARATMGLYDPTLREQMVVLGYDRAFTSLPRALPPGVVHATPGGAWQCVQVDAARRRLTLPAGSGLDLGGIAKGMAVDAALARLRALGITPALVNAGGDLAVRGSPPDDEQWPIEVPIMEGHAVVPFHHGALAASGVARRRWRQGEHLRHHLLDPRSGTPARSGPWSVTVAAATCTQAEVAATAAFVLGRLDGARFLEYRGLAGLLVEENGSSQAVGPWPRSTRGVEQ